MNKLFVFGDSYSTRFSHTSFVDHGPAYIKFKGYEVKNYSDLIAEHFNLNVYNFSECAICNEDIFSRFMDNYHNIQDDDMVLFSWTDISRFRYAKGKNWAQSTYYMNDLVRLTLDNRCHPLYEERQLKNMDFIDNVLKNNRVIHYSWGVKLLKDGETVRNETNNLIHDDHWNEKGQINLCNQIIEELSKSNKIRILNWEEPWDTTNNPNSSV